MTTLQKLRELTPIESLLSRVRAVANDEVESHDSVNEILRLCDSLEVAMNALEFECGDRCARGINPCNAREALDQINRICEGEGKNASL